MTKKNKKYKHDINIGLRETLTTHLLTHTLFDWLKFIWDPPNINGTYMIWWDPCGNLNRKS